MTRERILSIRGLSYRVRTHGEHAGRPWALLLHGFAGSSLDWQALAEILDEAGISSAAPDLPGHGGTGVPVDTTRCSPVETVSDLADLLDALDAPRAHWIGYSMGGRIALHAAVAAPERVLSLTLESASPGIEDPADRERRREADEELALQIERRGIDWFAEHWARQPIFETQRSLPPEARAALDERRRANRPEGLAASLRGAGQGAQRWLGSRDDLGSLAMPALLVTGALDPKYGALAASMAARMPRARHAVVDGAGHNVHLEQPEAFARRLLDHLKPYAEAVRAGA